MKVVDKTKNKHQQKKEAAASKNNKKEDVVNNQEGCCIPMIECLKPGDPLPQSLADGIKFECSNHDCLFAKQFAHVECFKELEDQMLILLRSHGGARGWPEEKLQMAFKKVWGRKGSIFLQGALKCKCGKGLMMKDESAWVYKEPKALVEPEPEKKERKKAKTKVLPELQHKNISHKLDHHYLSSRSPPPDASTFEEKYGPITKAPKRTRKETDNSMTSTNDTNVVKKRVPIGFAPIDPKPAAQKQKSEEPQPKHDRPVETKPPEPVKAWQKVDLSSYHILPDSTEHTVESETVISERVESEAMNLHEKLKAEEIAERKGNPWEHAEELRESFKISATTTSSKFVTTAVQTEETCFPNHCYKHYQNRNAMSVQTENDVPSPGSVLNGFDSGINSTACSPKLYANSYQQKPSFGDSNAFVPPGYPGDRLKKLSISDTPEMQKMNYSAASQPTIPVFSAPIINFLFKDNHFALEVCQNGRREYIKNALDNEWTPMFLSMLERKPTIGENAHSHCSYFPKYVVYDVLKIIGKSINEIAIDPKWGFLLVNQNGIVYFQIETSNGPSLLSQEIIIAAFFKLMKSQAETHLNTSVKEINLVTDCRLNESQKMVFSNAAAKLNFQIVSYRYSL